jgi:eukaryotic-like serine/threonine-protein kinase
MGKSDRVLLCPSLIKMALAVGTTISHYRILRKLGAGGMGEVYLAEDTQLDRGVAIRFLPPDAVSDEQANKRLIREDMKS